jgi:hypothetical protein
VKGRNARRGKVKSHDLNGSVSWTWTDANNNVYPLTACNGGVSGNSPETATCTTSALTNGTDTVTATYTANDGNHNTTASGSVSQTVNLATNTVTFTTPAPATAEYGSSFTVAATGLGTGAISYTSDGVVCTNVNATYTMISGTGTCTVTATQAADNNYPSASASEYVTAAAAVASVSVTTPGASTYGTPVTFTATITSDTGMVKGRNGRRVKSHDLNGSVSWSANTGCSASAVSGNSPETATCTTSSLAGGTDTVTATYTASDGNHNTNVSGSVSQVVSKASQTITFTTLPPTSAAYNSQFTVAATASSGLAVFYHSAGACSHSGATYTMTSGTGTCTVRATQNGNANYSAATAVSYSVTATTASTTIDVTNVNPAAENFAADAPVTITAVLAWTGTGAAPTGAVTIGGNGNGTYGTTSCGSASGNQITCTAIYTPTNADTPASYTETASFAGDNNYSASSSPETNNFAINSASATVTVLSSGSPSTYGQPVTFTANIVGENGDVKGRAKKNRVKSHQVSGNVTWSANTGCGTTTVTTNPDNSGTATCTTSSLNAGSDTVMATYSGDANHGGSSGSVSQVVSQASQTITFTTSAPSSAAYNSQFTVAATASSGLPVFFHSAGACSHSGATYTMTSGTGTCTVRATQLGNANYSAATPVTESVTATPASTTIDVTNVNPAAEDFAADAPVTITAVLAWTGTGAAPAGAVTIAGNGNGTYGATSCGAASGNQITCTAIYTPTNADLPGTYTETAAFAGDNNYSASSSPETNNFAINSATSTVTVLSSGSPSSYGTPVTFTANIVGENGDVKGRSKSHVKSHQVSGSVTWSSNTGCGTTTITTNPDNSGTATCTTSSLPAGTDTVVATYSGDSNHVGGGQGSISQVVNPIASITLNNMTQTYTGSALSPTVTTVPAGLSYSLTGAPDTNAGSYPVTVTITEPGYSGTTSGTFVISKATATVTFSSLTQTYTGSALSPTVTTVPAGLSYSPTGYPDTNVGSYPVTATVTDPNYTGTASGTFTINKATATVTLVNLIQTYTGSALSPTVTTVPAGLNASLTGAPDTKVGTYPVTATINDPNYTGSASGSFVIQKKAVAPTVTLTAWNNGVQIKSAAYNTTFTVQTTSSETGSEASSPVITLTTPTICSLAAQTVTMLTGTGSCELTATWAATDEYAAKTATLKVTAEKVKPTVTITAPSSAAEGSTFAVTTTAPADDAGTLTITVKPATVCTVSGTNVTMKTTKEPGTCDITAKWAASSDYAAASATATTTATAAE